MKSAVYIALTLSLVFGLLVACRPNTPTGAPVPSTGQTPGAPSAPSAAPTGATDQAVIEAAKKEGQVVIWSNTSTDMTRIVKQFHDKYPFIDLKLWDGRSTEITARLAEEAKAGKFTADVLTTSINDTIDLMDKGILKEYNWPAYTQKWSNQPNHNFYRTYITNLKLMVYNTDLVPPGDMPKTLDDVKSAKWRGKAIISSSGDVNPLWLAYLWGDGTKLNWEKSEAYWHELIQNVKPMVVSGYKVELVAAGEAALFVSAASITSQTLIDKGAPIAYAPVSPVMSTPFGLSMIKGAPHPNATKLFLDNLVSPEALLIWSEDFRSLVFDPEVAKKSRIHGILDKAGIQSKLLPVEIMTPENVRRSQAFWLRELGMRG